MLKVTENARQAIESIVSDANLPEGSGLRIDATDQPAAPSGSGVPLRLEVATQPADQDQVVAENGAKVFVAPSAAPILDDKILDVRVGDGQIQFVISPQGNGNGGGLT